MSMRIYYFPIDAMTMGPITEKTIMRYSIKMINVEIADTIYRIIKKKHKEKEVNFKVERSGIRLLIVSKKDYVVIDTLGTVEFNKRTYKLDERQYVELKRFMTPLFGI